VSFRVRLTREAQADLERLFDFVLEREPGREGGDLALAEQALEAIRAGMATLRTSPSRVARRATARSFAS
jgi:plasmid stabilization system protein ParE